MVVGFGLVNGSSGIEAFRWTQASGLVGLGDLAGGSFNSFAKGVSSDGNVVVGIGNSASGQEAFRWTQAGGMVGLGDLVGGSFSSSAHGVSSDGNVVVGVSSSANGPEAFRWTQAGGMVGLGDLAGGSFSSAALAASSDGSVVVGYGTNGSSDPEAFRWTQAGGMIGLGVLDGFGLFSRADGVSSDGSVVVGFSGSRLGDQAFRWTQAGGMVGLGDLDGGIFSSFANAVNSDGSVIVGSGYSGRGQEAFRWTQTTGIQSVTQWLTDNGVVVEDGVSLKIAEDVNSDGSVVVGEGDFGNGREAFIARVDTIGSGVISVAVVNESVSSTAEGLGVAQSAAITVMNGAHSRPMSRKVATGQQTMWIAGDWGYDNHNNRDGTVGLAEVGLGHNFGITQVNVSLGKTWNSQSLTQKGDIDVDGQYIVVEAIIPVSEEKGLYTTLGTYSHWGDADIRRGYLNAGSPDSSLASPNTHTWGLRARIDWENAYTLKTVQMSPYADLSYSDSKIDSYTETGGGFPAHFDRRDEDITELRAGINGAMPFSTTTIQLVSNIEIAHRLDDEGAGTAGQVLGLFSFSLDGQKYDSTWLKIGIGIEAELRKGKGYIMLNSTTEGEMPNAWLAASYQIAF